MKTELFVFLFGQCFTTLTNLDAQIRGAKTWYSVFDFGLNQPLGDVDSQYL